MYQFMSKLRNIARIYCANWDVGKCLGCVIAHSDEEFVWKIDSKLAGKDCIVEDGCKYFKEVVIPGIADERQRREAKISSPIS
tara:strand:+ start:1177 stop:1425 length:249 start_codon:yes stop_codon:yes gene_type:complete